MHFFASTINDDVQVIPYLQTALDYTPKTSKKLRTILTAMGNALFCQGLFDDAMEYHQKINIFCTEYKRFSSICPALGEIAQIHKVRKEYDEAEKLLEEDIAISKRHRDERNTMFAQILLGKYIPYSRTTFQVRKKNA